MMKSMAIFLMFSLLYLVVPSISESTARDAEEFFFDQTLGDFDEELETARDQGKQGILVFFEMDECPFCHRMKTTVLNQPEVQAYFKRHFLIFSLDVEGDVEITDFTGEVITQKDFAFKQNRVRATPVFGFYDLRGEQVARYTGATRNVQEFLWLGEYVVNGVYKEQSFTRFKRERKKQLENN